MQGRSGVFSALALAVGEDDSPVARQLTFARLRAITTPCGGPGSCLSGLRRLWTMVGGRTI